MKMSCPVSDITLSKRNEPLKSYICESNIMRKSGPGSSVGIATDYGLDGPRIETRWGEIFRAVQTGPAAHPASCTMGTGSFPGVKCGRLRAAAHLPHSSAAVMEEWSYTSTHPLGHNRACNGTVYLYVIRRKRDRWNSFTKCRLSVKILGL